MPLEVVLIILALGIAAGLVTQGVVVMKRRRKPATVTPAAVAASPASRGMSCCAKPAWVPERDLGSARGFDMSLGKCGACGAAWINAWCTASSMGGYEPVKAADAEAMRSTGDPEALKQLMRRWAERLA